MEPSDSIDNQSNAISSCNEYEDSFGLKGALIHEEVQIRSCKIKEIKYTQGPS